MHTFRYQKPTFEVEVLAKTLKAQNYSVDGDNKNLPKLSLSWYLAQQSGLKLFPRKPKGGNISN